MERNTELFTLYQVIKLQAMIDVLGKQLIEPLEYAQLQLSMRDQILYRVKEIEANYGVSYPLLSQLHADFHQDTDLRED